MRVRAPETAVIAAACALMFSGGCASSDVGRADGVALAQRPEDEVRLWNRASEMDEIIRHSGFILNAPDAELYLNTLIHRVAPEELAPGVRLRAKIVLDPTLNAFALPNGSIYVHSGLLAQIENEAQLAAVLCHEVSHAYLRHGLRGKRSADNTLAVAATLTYATGGLAGLLSFPMGASAMAGYSRDLEREADTAGFQRLIALGYDPNEAIAVFRLFEAEISRSKLKQSFFFGSHPRVRERIDSFTQAVAALPKERQSGTKGAEPFLAANRSLFPLTARAALSAGDDELALRCIARFHAAGPSTPQSAALHLEILRRRGSSDDLALALSLAEAYLVAHPDGALLHREKGLLLHKKGDPDAAKPSLRRYLELEPTARDRPFIEPLAL